MISREDVKEVIRRLTGEQQLSEEDMEQLIKNVSSKMRLVRSMSLSY